MPEATWFKFDVKAFLFGTRKFKAEETGAYILMLCHQWDKGFIPKNDDEIEEISGLPIKKLDRVLKKFVETKIGDALVLINERMDAEKREWNEYLEKQASNGSKGGRPRKSENPEKPTANPPLTQKEPKKSLLDKNRIDKNRIDDDVDNARENFDNAADSYLPTTTIEPYEDIADCMLNLIHTGRYAKAREQICIREHFTVDQLRIRAEMFNEHLTAIGQSTKQMTDYLKHFNYWLPKNAARSQQQQPGKRGLVI